FTLSLFHIPIHIPKINRRIALLQPNSCCITTQDSQCFIQTLLALLIAQLISKHIFSGDVLTKAIRRSETVNPILRFTEVIKGFPVLISAQGIICCFHSFVGGMNRFSTLGCPSCPADKGNKTRCSQTTIFGPLGGR